MSKSHAEYARERRQTMPDHIRDLKLRHAFGISLAEYDARLLAQGGVCASCRRPETTKRHGKVRRLSVDHNHQTGKVRGLLCSYCNLAIGYLYDDPLRAHALACYLEKTDV